MLKSLFAAALAVSAPFGAGAQSPAPAPPAAQPGPDLWMVSDTQIASVPARIAFPRRAGAVQFQRHQQLSHPGEGIDSAIQYQSPDREIWATVYIYYPGLPHAGLTAFATDHAIRGVSESPVEGGAFRVVAAGGVDGVAIRASYSGWRGDNASSAAFVKAGRWIVKLRVSGPSGRRAEIEAAMDELLRGAAFGRANPPLPAAPLTVTECAPGTGERAAGELPDPPGAEIAAHALLATFDGGGIDGTGPDGARTTLPSRLPERFCRSMLAVGQARLPILRAEPGDARSIDGRTMLLALVSDSGRFLEVVHAGNLGGHILLWHEIGQTNLLGRFDAVPSDAQIAAILQNSRSGPGRPRVPVRLRPNRGPEMFLPGLAPAREGAPTT